MISTTNHIRGEQLRQLRESQGISVSNLARHVHLSTAQILQLEYGDVLPGKRSMFYSSAIEEIAAMKVANALGADPQSLWNNSVVAQLQTVTPESKPSTTHENVDSFENIEKAVVLSHAAPVVKTGNNTLMPVLGSAIDVVVE
jgi:transcriptional regulator with XRE-family HTH domain